MEAVKVMNSGRITDRGDSNITFSNSFPLTSVTALVNL